MTSKIGWTIAPGERTVPILFRIALLRTRNSNFGCQSVQEKCRDGEIISDRCEE